MELISRVQNPYIVEYKDSWVEKVKEGDMEAMANHVLTHVHSLQERLGDSLSAHPNELVCLLSRYVSQGKGLLQPHQLLTEFEDLFPKGDREKLKDGVFGDILRATQEAIVLPPWAALVVRPRPGVWEYVRVNVNEMAVEELSASEYLQFKEKLVNGCSNDNFGLELDFEPFNASFPRPNLSKSIGNGVQFLNRHLSSKMFHQSMDPLLDFLRMHNYKGKAEEYLSMLPSDTPFSEFEHRFQDIGLEKGWGDTAQHGLEMIHLLLDLLEAPDPCTLENFSG